MTSCLHILSFKTHVEEVVLHIAVHTGLATGHPDYNRMTL